MTKFRIELQRGWAALATAVVAALCIFSGCASAPKPAPPPPAPVTPGPQAEEIKPLAEEDRPATETAAEAPAPAPAEQQPPVVEEDTSRLLSRAAEQAATDIPAALALVDEAASKQPACVPCFFDRGVLLEKVGKPAEAMAAYRQALAIFGGHRESLVNLSNLLLRQGKGAEALSLLSRGAKIAPQDTVLRNQFAKVMIELGQPDQAAEQAKGVLSVDERNVDAMLHLARVYHLRGKLELAERILLKAQQIDQTDARIFNRLGFIYLDMKDNTSAIASFKKAVELDPQLAEARNNLGSMFSRAHDYDSAIEQFRQALVLDAGFVEAMMNLGNALRGAQKFKEAEEAYRQAAAMRPNDSAAHCNLGLLYLDDEVPDYTKTQRFALAVKELDACRESDANMPKLAAYREEAAKKHERALKDEALQKKREEEKRRQEEEKKAQAEAAARAAAEKAAAEKAAAEKAAAEKAAAEKAAAEKAAAEKAAAEKAAAEKAAAEKAAAEKAAAPGKKLGGGKDDEVEPPGEGKVGGDEK